MIAINVFYCSTIVIIRLDINMQKKNVHQSSACSGTLNISSDMNLVEICKENKITWNSCNILLHYLSLKFVNITLGTVSLKNTSMFLYSIRRPVPSCFVMCSRLCNDCVGAIEQSTNIRLLICSCVHYTKSCSEHL